MPAKNETSFSTLALETLTLEERGSALFVTIKAPPMNMLGPELVRDLGRLIEMLDLEEPYKVVVFKSADPDFFISHVDVGKAVDYPQEAANPTCEASIGLLFRRLAQTKAVTIAQIEGRTRGAGSAFVRHCNMRFAARGRAVFSQWEAAVGAVPVGGEAPHRAPVPGQGLASEVGPSADDHGAEFAEHYGWVNRSLPAEALEPFVADLAQRIASYPISGLLTFTDR